MASEFAGACDKSPDGTHRVVNLFADVPHLGCLHCRLRNKLKRPTRQQAFDLLRAGGISAAEASRRSGYVSKYPSGRRPAKTGSEVAKTPYIPATENPVPAGGSNEA